MKLKNVYTTNNGLDQKAFNMEWYSKTLNLWLLAKPNPFEPPPFESKDGVRVDLLEFEFPFTKYVHVRNSYQLAKIYNSCRQNIRLKHWNFTIRPKISTSIFPFIFQNFILIAGFCTRNIIEVHGQFILKFSLITIPIAKCDDDFVSIFLE